MSLAVVAIRAAVAVTAVVIAIRPVVVPGLLGFAVLARRGVSADRADDAEHHTGCSGVTVRIAASITGVGRSDRNRGERNRSSRRGSNGAITNVKHDFALSFVNALDEGRGINRRNRDAFLHAKAVHP